MQANVANTTQVYSSKLSSLTNVIYTFGQSDPWAALSMKDLTTNNITFYVAVNGSMSSDLFSVLPTDDDGVKSVKQKVIDFINSLV